jgi:hypothetical protein
VPSDIVDYRNSTDAHKWRKSKALGISIYCKTKLVERINNNLIDQSITKYLPSLASPKKFLLRLITQRMSFASMNNTAAKSPMLLPGISNNSSALKNPISRRQSSSTNDAEAAGTRKLWHCGDLPSPRKPHLGAPRPYLGLRVFIETRKIARKKGFDGPQDQPQVLSGRTRHHMHGISGFPFQPVAIQ